MSNSFIDQILSGDLDPSSIIAPGHVTSGLLSSISTVANIAEEAQQQSVAGNRNERLRNDTQIIANNIGAQIEADKTVTSDGGSADLPYIAPLSQTVFADANVYTPHADPSYNGGSIYDPKLLNSEGKIYLRQYINDDVETGAVWIFQYAPSSIQWSRSANYVEDKTFNTNVQPTHFTNVSGKKLKLSDVLLEGMTIGKTVTGAVTALEAMMSIINYKNRRQISPYAYRLIVGTRTLSEPISNEHIPFVIESLAVREEMYDNAGELLKVKIELSLTEVPVFQINDNRKLLLAVQSVGQSEAESTCDALAKKAGGFNEQLKKSAADNDSAIRASEAEIPANTIGVSLLFDENLKARSSEVKERCVADSQAFTAFDETKKEYEKNACTDTLPSDGLELFAAQWSDSGIYYTLGGRAIQDLDFFRRFLISSPLDVKLLANSASGKMKFVNKKSENLLSPCRNPAALTKEQQQDVKIADEYYKLYEQEKFSECSERIILGAGTSGPLAAFGFGSDSNDTAFKRVGKIYGNRFGFVEKNKIVERGLCVEGIKENYVRSMNKLSALDSSTRSYQLVNKYKPEVDKIVANFRAEYLKIQKENSDTASEANINGGCKTRAKECIYAKHLKETTNELTKLAQTTNPFIGE